MANIIEEPVNYAAPAHEIDWDFPLWNEILPNLWLGGTDDFDTIEYAADQFTQRDITKSDFDTVVTLYAWARPVDWQVEELRYGFYDSGMEDVDMETLSRAAAFAHFSWKKGNRVLVRCQAGINRSGLTMALVLMKEGYSAKDAIALMREKRSKWVLLNRDFEDFLIQLDKSKKGSTLSE